MLRPWWPREEERRTGAVLSSVLTHTAHMAASTSSSSGSLPAHIQAQLSCAAGTRVVEQLPGLEEGGWARQPCVLGIGAALSALARSPAGVHRPVRRSGNSNVRAAARRDRRPQMKREGVRRWGPWFTPPPSPPHRSTSRQSEQPERRRARLASPHAPPQLHPSRASCFGHARRAFADSKALTAEARETLFARICSAAAAPGLDEDQPPPGDPARDAAPAGAPDGEAAPGPRSSAQRPAAGVAGRAPPAPLQVTLAGRLALPATPAALCPSGRGVP